MNDFKRNDRFGGKRTGGGKPPFTRSGGGFGRPQLPMFPATCANCGKATEVPFRPDGQRPIYCRDCLGGNKTSGPAQPREFQAREFPRREFQKPAFRAPAQSQAQTPDPRIDDIQRNIAKMQAKLDQILLEIAVGTAQTGAATSVVTKKKFSKKK